MSDERCEMCLRLFPTKLISEFKGHRFCTAKCFVAVTSKRPAKRQTGAKRATIAPVQRTQATAKKTALDAYSRCEQCNTLYRTAQMIEKDDRHLCLKCAAPEYQWFCAAIYGSDTKIRKAITKHFASENLKPLLKRVVIPKVRTARRSKSSWEVLDQDEKVIGHVSAVDHATAFYDAKAKFQKNRKKTVYKPDPNVDHLEKVVKTKIGRRVYYEAVSNTGRMMARITGCKNQKHATEALTRIYGKKDANNNPRESALDPTDVLDVRLAKQGGKLIVQNQRAMPGYILVLMKPNELSFSALKAAKGVYSVLPFTEQMTYEDVEKAEEEGDELPVPTPIPETQVEAVVEIKKPASLNFEVGDEVTLVGDNETFAGMKGTVRKIIGDPVSPDVEVEVELWGRAVSTKVSYLNIRK